MIRLLLDSSSILLCGGPHENTFSEYRLTSTVVYAFNLYVPLYSSVSYCLVQMVSFRLFSFLTWYSTPRVPTKILFLYWKRPGISYHSAPDYHCIVTSKDRLLVILVHTPLLPTTDLKSLVTPVVDVQRFLPILVHVFRNLSKVIDLSSLVISKFNPSL